MASIESNVDKFVKTANELLREIEQRIRELKKSVRTTAVEIAKEEAPVYTGEFRESIVSIGSDDEPEIVSAHPKAEQIIRGTQPSEGLYIKASKGVGKRLTKASGRKKIGMHPGTPPHPVFERAYERLRERVMEVFRAFVRWLLRWR